MCVVLLFVSCGNACWPWCLQLFTTSMDLAFVHRTWEKWASNHVGSSGEQAKICL